MTRPGHPDRWIPHPPRVRAGPRVRRTLAAWTARRRHECVGGSCGRRFRRRRGPGLATAGHDRRLGSDGAGGGRARLRSGRAGPARHLPRRRGREAPARGGARRGPVHRRGRRPVVGAPARRRAVPAAARAGPAPDDGVRGHRRLAAPARLHGLGAGAGRRHPGADRRGPRAARDRRSTGSGDGPAGAERRERTQRRHRVALLRGAARRGDRRHRGRGGGRGLPPRARAQYRGRRRGGLARRATARLVHRPRMGQRGVAAGARADVRRARLRRHRVDGRQRLHHRLGGRPRLRRRLAPDGACRPRRRRPARRAWSASPRSWATCSRP